jgi:hypothetical protein
MRETGPGRSSFVDECMDVLEAVVQTGAPALLPRVSDELKLCVFEIGERVDVARRVDDDLLALEGGVQVRHDANLPSRRVWLAPLGQYERLGRGPAFAPLVEGTAVAFLGRFLFEPGSWSAGPVGSARCDYDLAAGDRIDAKVDRQVLSRRLLAAWTSGPISSIGNGRISVDVRSELISSIVCR